MEMDREEAKGKVRKLWGETRESLAKLGKEAVIVAKKGKEEAMRAARIGKLRLDIVGINRKKDEKFKDMGIRTHELLSKGEIEDAELKGLSKQVEKLLVQLKNKETEIEKTRKVKGEVGL
ncbi:unnamed protein product [marine sediment metagenome]|uniref:Uncharacterized protein n=1 Tax=marine sediment metagenome TaxID=412755 RepID=X1JBR3_9ZZZZ